jgi:hypothetical protein
MKVPSMKALLVLFTLVLFLSTSCNEDEVIPQKSDEELFELTIEKITSNESILEDVFFETSTVVTRAAIGDALKTSSSKATFIANMNALVEEIFKEEIKSNSEQLASDVFIKFEGVDGESVKKTISELMLNADNVDPLVTYAEKVNSLIDDRSASGRGLLVLIQKLIVEESSEALAAEQVSLNFDKIKLMYDLQSRVIAGSTITAETDDEIEAILAKDGVPPVAIGLLLPAVQKMHNYNGTSETASTPYWDWLIDNVNPEINGGLNRDIIRRYNAAGFMGALQFLLSDAYQNDNQDIASMLLLRARYQASLMFIWNDIWDKSKSAITMKARVKSNEAILESALAETARVITRKAILDARDASADKAAFISDMNELVKGIFNSEIQKKAEEYGGGVVIATGDLDGDGTTSELAELVINNAADPLEEYVGGIQMLIENKGKSQGNTAGDLNPLFTIIKRVIENGAEKETFMSVSGGSLSHANEIKKALLYGRKSGVDPVKAVEDLAVLYNIPTPLMAMLLPAVQKVRNYNGTDETADTPYLKWLERLDPMLASGANHDVVSKYDAAGFLGALHVFVSDQYRSDNPDYASLLLLKARYQASTTMIFADLWDK